MRRGGAVVVGLALALAACSSTGSQASGTSITPSTVPPTTAAPPTSSTTTTASQPTTTTFDPSQYAYADAAIDVRTRNARLTLTTDQRDCAAHAVIAAATPSERDAMLQLSPVITTDRQNRLAAVALSNCVPPATLLALITASFERQRVIRATCTAQHFVASSLARSTLWFSLFTQLPPDLDPLYTAALRAAQASC